MWSNFTADQVYRTDNWTMLKTSLHWLSAVVFGGLGRNNPRSLLDSSPLGELLTEKIRFSNIERAINRGHLDALAITASAYSSARSVTFFQGLEGLKAVGESQAYRASGQDSNAASARKFGGPVRVLARQDWW